MMQRVATKSFSNVLEKGKSYDILREEGGNYIIQDQDGFEIGFNKMWFDHSEDFDPREFAISIMRLMLFPKSKDFRPEDIIKAKSYSILVIEVVKGNCETLLDQCRVNLIRKAIENTEMI